MDNQPSLDEFEDLFVNNPDLQKIESHLNQFNPIRVMKMQSMEIRHSAILAWLLTPSETHGLSDRFLKAFLCEAFRGQDEVKPNAISISQADLRDAVVRCEWRNIDIFIVSESNDWAFVVENKFNSSQSDGQLATYMSRVESIFRSRTNPLVVGGVFLTLWDEEPEDDRYCPISYETVYTLLSGMMEQHGTLLTSEVRVFLQHYINILKDETGMSDELKDMEKLARQLYRDHRKVLDFVIENGASTDFAFAVRDVFGDDVERLDTVPIKKNDYVFLWSGNSQVSFIPLSWFKELGEDEWSWPGCENWWSGFPLICWLELAPSKDGIEGKLKLYAEVGPLSDHEARKELIDAISELAAKKDLSRIKFQTGAATKGRKYSKFLSRNTENILDVNNSEEIARAMTKLLKSFSTEFEAISKILPDITEYAEKD